MKLTRGEFCEFSLNTRFLLLREFGNNILERKIKMTRISVYIIFDFYVEVYQNTISKRVEKVEPLKNIQFLETYSML